MNRQARVLVLVVSIPVMAFAVVGGLMGRAFAKEDSYQYLRMFEEVVSLIVNNYVEEVNVDRVMHGAMHGLADSLDPDSAYLDAAQVKAFEQPDAAGVGETGLELTRQYYLRVIAARDASPAARAGLMPGDFIRAIDGHSTRDTSVVEGQRLLRGAPGSQVRLTVLRGNAAEPHEVELVREVLPPPMVRARLAAPEVAYVRVPAFDRGTADRLQAEVARLRRDGATRLVIDVRGTAVGDIEHGLAAARLFVPRGVLIYRQAKGEEREAIAAASGDGAIALPVAVLTDNGTAGAAEVFAAALAGNRRATLVGERTLGRAGRQKLVRLPDGSGLLLTHLLYLTPDGTAIQEKGLTPDVLVEQPDLDFGAPPPATDATLERAIATLGEKAAA